MFLPHPLTSTNLILWQTGYVLVPQTLFLRGETTLKTKMPITISSQTTCTPEEAVLNFLRNKKYGMFMLGTKAYTSSVCAHNRRDLKI
jgi:hypothetical protein